MKSKTIVESIPEVTPIYIKKESVSDDVYLLAEIMKSSGSYVKKGDAVCSIESSKTVIEIEAPCDGYIYYGYQLHKNVSVGSVIAVVCSEQNVDLNTFSSFNFSPLDEVHGNNIKHDISISNEARTLIEKYNINMTHFGSKKLITKKDVENVLAKDAPVDLSNIKIDSSRSIVIIGGGGHASMCIDILKQNENFDIVGIVDSSLSPESEIHGYTIIGDDYILKQLYDLGVRFAILGIGAVLDSLKRERLFNMIKNIGFIVPTLIHSKSIIEASAKIGEGNQIMAGAIIGSNVTIGSNCIINSGSNICHGSNISDNVHLAPGAIVAGNVSIGKNTLIGMSAVIYLGVNIGNNVVVNNGVIIDRNVSNNQIVRK